MSNRILVIDDDPATRAALESLFGSEGYEVVTAPDGNTAIGLLEPFAPDLIVTDMQMPRATGLDVIREVRARIDLAQVPIIVVSGSSERRDRIAGFREGADDFVSKPIELEELLARVRRALQRHGYEIEQSRRSVIDELTHLLNRRGLEHFFAREAERCARDGASLSAVFVDLDEFKAINDSFGHMLGDVALTVVAEALQSEVRATDRVGRLGGDEFLVLMPGTREAESVEVIDRLRKRMPLEVVAGSRQGLSVAFSVGAAIHAPGESFTSLVARADQAMYQDKRRRRAARDLG